MAKTGIGALIFAIIFGVIFGFSAYIFFSIAFDLDLGGLGVFIGVGAALVGVMLIFSGGAGLISGFITVALLVSGFSNLKSYLRQKKLQNQ